MRQITKRESRCNIVRNCLAPFLQSRLFLCCGGQRLLDGCCQIWDQGTVLYLGTTYPFGLGYGNLCFGLYPAGFPKSSFLKSILFPQRENGHHEDIFDLLSSCPSLMSRQCYSDYSSSFGNHVIEQRAAGNYTQAAHTLKACSNRNQLHG
jgi:hypothetical protein